MTSHSWKMIAYVVKWIKSPFLVINLPLAFNSVQLTTWTSCSHRGRGVYNLIINVTERLSIIPSYSCTIS